MKYKAIVSDFDGTLVGKNQDIPQPVVQAIKRFTNKGNIFSIATGRMYAGRIESQVRNLGLNSLQITRGGSEILDISGKDISGKVVVGIYIKNDEAKKIISYLQKKNQRLYIDKDVSIYTDENISKEYGRQVKPLSSLEYSKIPKIGVLAGITKLEAEDLATDMSDKFHYINVFVAHNPKGWGLDITATGATKQIALLEWAKLNNLKQEEIVGVGDSYNDYPLLTAAGVGVAMGNAVPELKEIADFIAPAQEENGILEVINKYFR